MMGTSRVVATMLATVLLASPALAQPTAAQKQQAGDLVKQAIAKSQANDHEAAIELYLKAYAIVPSPPLLSNVGSEYQKAEKPVEALKYFCMYLEKEPTGNLVSYATAQAKALYFQLGGKTVEDKDVCKAPVSPTPPPTEPPAAQPPPPEVAAPPPAPRPVQGGGTLKLVGLVAGGAGLVALGAGFYFGSEAQTISDDITNHTDTSVPWRDDIKDYEAKGQRYENLQIAFLVAGGALVIGGTAMYLIGRSKASTIEVTPTASSTGAGVAISGAF